jgi:sterol desaturase/sphingolipid hydroxylase (fatty acid hydroxylase superfamily)
MAGQHYISTKNESVRMFESDFMEFFSHVHPITPLVLYLPVVAYSLYLAGWREQLPFFLIVALFLVGWLIWTLLEYVIHRFLFHYEPKSRFGKALHFVVHGVHHDYPNDASRLVMPPVVSLPLAVFFYLLFALVFGRFCPPIMAGLISGYIFYDSLHYATHHFAMRKGVWSWLKQYHLRHHYQDDHSGYGVSSPLWDYIFGTTRR